MSHILDWWPIETIPMPVGYHVTAPMLQNELAPVGFDSHYGYDATSQDIHYVHSGLRNASLLGDYLGAGGLCRSHSIGMPLWNANTNRICTRDSLQQDTPHLPVQVPPNPLPSQMGPYSSSFLEKNKYGPLLCAPSAQDVPWIKTSPHQSAGSVPGLLLPPFFFHIYNIIL